MIMATCIIKLFRNGIFLQQTSRFGKIAEIMIQKKYHFTNPPISTTKYDLWDSNNHQRIEVKFSTVREKNEKKITETTIVNQCLVAKFQNKPIVYRDCELKCFDRNIEQVKTDEFDLLYYGLFFWDKILIFRVDSKNISAIPGWSSKMHREKAVDYTAGQFHITNDNVQHHIENYLIDTLTYKQLYELVTPYENMRVLLGALLKEIKRIWKH